MVLLIYDTLKSFLYTQAIFDFTILAQYVSFNKKTSLYKTCIVQTKKNKNNI